MTKIKSRPKRRRPLTPLWPDWSLVCNVGIKHFMWCRPYTEYGWIQIRLVEMDEDEKPVKSWSLSWNGSRLSKRGQTTELKKKDPALYDLTVRALQYELPSDLEKELEDVWD